MLSFDIGIEKSYLILLFLYVFSICFLLFFNPYKYFYQPKEVSQLYFTKAEMRIKNCGEVNQIEETKEYKKIRICSFGHCYTGHLDNKNEFSAQIKKYFEKNICFFGKIKKVYDNYYLEIESIEVGDA
ncbi:MAG: hypothetical protein ACK4J0_01130 [Candidatus Anstonellaceae archaeon]